MTEPKKPPIVEALSARGAAVFGGIALLALVVMRVGAEVFARLTMHWSDTAVAIVSRLFGVAVAVGAALVWRRLTRAPSDG